MNYINTLPQLIQTFPRLFKGKQPRSSSEVGQGWYELVKLLCKDIDESLNDEELAQFEVLQIKEKFGSLRFYFKASENMRTKIRDLILEAYEKSLFICDQCGADVPCASCNKNV